MAKETIPIQSFKLSGIRGMIANKMRDSLQSSAQLSYHSECMAKSLLAHRAQLKTKGSGVSIEDLIIKAVSDTLHKCPLFNSRIEENEVSVIKEHNISVAVSLPGGLVAPTIFNVQNKSLEDISVARKDLIVRAKVGKLTLREMTGGSFTVSNLGLRRINYFTPILNSPQIAILGIGQIVNRPWVNEKSSISVEPIMGLSLTSDHRVVDGDPSGEFLGILCDCLENG